MTLTKAGYRTDLENAFLLMLEALRHRSFDPFLHFLLNYFCFRRDHLDVLYPSSLESIMLKICPHFELHNQYQKFSSFQVFATFSFCF
jgi:hypothetical protein